jgi:hypothetical protein
MRGVYKYGFGNYQKIKDSPKMSWTEMSDKVFPTPDKFTKRLKKILKDLCSHKADFNKIVCE